MKKPWPVLFCLTACWLERAPNAAAQTTTPVQPIFVPNLMSPGVPFQEVGNLGYLPVYDQNFLTNGYHPELPNDEIIRTSGSSYQNMFYSVGEGGRFEANAGNLQVQAPDLLQTTLAYQDTLPNSMTGTNAEIRVGRFYYDFTSLSAAVLYSDNVNWSQTNRQGGVISAVTLRGVAMIQLLDNLRLAASLGVVYFPITSKIGVEGFTEGTAAARLFLGNNENTRAQLTYDLKAGEWDIFLYDQVRATQALFADQFNVTVAAPFDDEDREGRYAFYAPNSSAAGGQEVRVNDELQQNGRNNATTFVYANNQVGATISRLLPTDTRLRVGAYRLDYWYLGENNAFMPASAQVAFVDLHSERENLRFKPFASYEVFQYGNHRWDQEALGGIRGPITENLELTGAVGYFVGGRPGQNSTVSYVQLNHQIGPLTSQAFSYRRDVTAPVQDLEQSFSYELRQRLGPHFTVVPFVVYATYDDPLNTGTGTKELRGGTVFTSDPSAKTSIVFGGIYTRVQYTTGSLMTWYRWSALAQVKHHLTDSLVASLTYQYQDRDSTEAGDSFYENLVMLNLTKYFY
jgi:hypothetical protein